MAAPSTNSAPIYANPTAVASSVAALNVEIYPGESKYLLVDPEENGQGLSLISSSGVVNSALLSKANFRTRLGFAIGAFAAAVAAAVASTFFVGISTAIIALRSGITTVRASSGNPIQFANDQGNIGLALGSGANGNAVLAPDGSGSAYVATDPAVSGYNFRAIQSSGCIMANGGTIYTVTHATGFQVRNNIPLDWYFGNSTDRVHRFNNNGYTISASVAASATPTAGVLMRDSTYGHVIGDGTDWSTL